MSDKQMSNPETSATRTPQQQKAIEVYCRMLAQCMNMGGYDQRKVFDLMKEGVEIPWSQRAVKATMWALVQDAMFEKKSTTQLSPQEVNRVYEVLNRWTFEKMGITVEFPNRHGPMEI